ncbi:hypothetical protein SLE2022_135410 [Rubroshorea leprosula]
MASEAVFVKGATNATTPWKACTGKKSKTQRLHLTVRASHSIDDKNRVYKQLGLFSLKRKIEDVILRAEMLAPPALELEEARRIKQEEMVRAYNLWDDPVKSNEILFKLAGSAKVVDALKDLKYKAEEAKLITELAEIDAINYSIFKQAYYASLDVSKSLDNYEMSRLLVGTYDMEGASLIIQAQPGGHNSEIWAEQLLGMYIKWANKHGYRGRIVEKYTSMNNGVLSAAIEFEFEYAYGYLLGERGVHHKMTFQKGSVHHEVSSVIVDVIPLFLGPPPDLQINDYDLIISSPLLPSQGRNLTEHAVSIQHIPTGVTVLSSGERSYFTNKIKALNRLKAKLLVIAKEQGISDVGSIKMNAITNAWQIVARRYASHPHKLVQDVKTGIQLPDLNSVLNGNIEPLIGAHINMRQSSHTI